MKYDYDGYGNPTITYDSNNIASINNILYKGYYYDKESGLYYLINRYYNPRIRRFMSLDSIEYLNYDRSRCFNLYAYCNNNPVMYFDPKGEFGILTGLIIGAIIGVTAAFSAVAYMDYKDDGKIFNGSIEWYDYLGASVLGGIIGALTGAATAWLSGISFTATIPTIGLTGSGGTLSIGVTGSVTVTMSGLQVFGVLGLTGLTIMMASHNRPGNNVRQNKQFKKAAREVGLDPTDARTREKLKKFINTLEIID